MDTYTVTYEDDLCHRYSSFFFDYKIARKWCELNKHNWMRWHLYDSEGREKYGGCNGSSYCGM
jgi:hypothetical protein